MADGPLLYSALADWFAFLTPPADYAEEAAFYGNALAGAAGRVETLLELGSGGGHVASHLTHRFRCTLTDLSPEMLAASRRLNPGCEHVQGDMRSLRLGRSFDAVLLQDAVMYLTTEEDLRRAMETAFVHCRPGGAALFAADFTRETFRPGAGHGGSDGPDRAIRYLEWSWDPDPSDTTFVTDFAYLLREGPPGPEATVRVVQDRHVEGLFPRATWLRLLAEAGFAPREPPPGARAEAVGEVFLAVRP